ncbi:MAG: hypothetical protein IKS54_10450 [Erysipelotrichaceae bacterium]|nr:hypothetical protein [Erysipelotrichaceae bacterium]
MKQIEEVLNNRYEHKLFPFFWQKGQSEEVISQYIEKMYEQGIHDFCVESRPHPDFLEEGWWKLMDHIIDEAKKRNMHIWILDDAKFPTGYANGKVPSELKKRYLNYHRFDVTGNGSVSYLNVSCPAGIRGAMDKRHANDRIVAAILTENDTSEMRSFKEDILIDVTGKISDGLLKLELDRKDYSIFVVYETSAGEEKVTEDYLDPMNPEATQILLNEVYQKHYDHYSDEFRKTITAFFSDEPRFGNTGKKKDLIGRTDTPLPWNKEVLKRLIDDKKIKTEELVFLFQGNGHRASEVRFAYVDTVSRLYSDCFAKVIGNWCKDHGVMYVGHVIEDDNVHARLGYGCGHYFRAMAGEDVAGIDVIGGQIVPGMDYPHDAFSTGGSDGEFYHYALARMAASCAKHDPKKQGRVMCEAFGAYGWVEGLQMMKWITDHLVSHGVNILVPHAFDPADFPDWDCPPHFYAHGMNPQYPYFHVWSQYADRLCALFSKGKKISKIGVLYHGFAEWCGNTMYFQKVCKVLQQKQLDSDIISEDYLSDLKCENGKYSINGNGYDVLIVPECDRLPFELTETLRKLSEKIRVIFVNSRPENISFGEAVRLEDLPQECEDSRTVYTDGSLEHLNVYEYEKEGGKVWMLFNEDVYHSITTTLSLDTDKRIVMYDAFENRIFEMKQRSENGKATIDLDLEPYESIVILEGEGGEKKAEISDLLTSIEADRIFRKEYCSKDYENTDAETIRSDILFSGTVRYEYVTEFDDNNVILKLNGCKEVANVEVNGIDCGTAICGRYEFDISKAAVKGKNHIVVSAANTLVHKQRDLFSMYVPIENTYPDPVIDIYKKA